VVVRHFFFKQHVVPLVIVFHHLRVSYQVLFEQLANFCLCFVSLANCKWNLRYSWTFTRQRSCFTLIWRGTRWCILSWLVWRWGLSWIVTGMRGLDRFTCRIRVIRRILNCRRRFCSDVFLALHQVFLLFVRLHRVIWNTLQEFIIVTGFVDNFINDIPHVFRKNIVQFFVCLFLLLLCFLFS
jgi:hypothetical protein